MLNSFANRPIRKRSFQESLKGTLYLLKYSFTLIGKNTGIARPTVYLAVLSLLMTSLLFGALACFFSGTNILAGVIALVILIVILVPLRFFIRTYLKAIQSWMSYLTITGHVITYTVARSHIKQRTGSLMFLGFVDMIVAKMKNQGSDEKGITGIITRLLLSAFAEVWDLLNHYMIPAVVIEGKSLTESLPEIKAIRDNVPATLAGVFGIDFAGDTLRRLLSLPYLIILAIGAGLGYLLGPVFPSTSFNLSNLFPSTSFNLSNHSVCWVPVMLALFLNCSIGGILKACVESVKTIYFTIFYATIMHPDQIGEVYRDHLTSYLRMGEADTTASEPTIQ